MVNVYLYLQMRKEADERAKVVDAKLVEMGTAQRQIGEQVAEFLKVVERNCLQSAEKTRQAMDRVRDDILGTVVGDTAELVAALALNENVLVRTDYANSRYLQLLFSF